MKALDFIARAQKKLAAYLQDDRAAGQEAVWLTMHVLGLSSTELLTHTKEVSIAQEAAFEEALHERTALHKPLAYILKNVPFAGLILPTKPPLLIPRHETEELVLKVITLFKKEQQLVLLDVCTGTGAIALALAHHLPDAQVTGSDLMPYATQHAATSGQELGITNATFIVSDLFNALPAGTLFDCIISNPPYIPDAEWRKLPETVRAWEDEKALRAGADGLIFYRRLFEDARHFLTGRFQASGLPELIVEHGAAQQAELVELAQRHSFRVLEAWQDSFHNPRALLLTRA